MAYGEKGTLKTYDAYLDQCSSYGFYPLSYKQWQANITKDQTQENETFK